MKINNLKQADEATKAAHAFCTEYVRQAIEEAGGMSALSECLNYSRQFVFVIMRRNNPAAIRKLCDTIERYKNKP